jgi:flagellar basal body-associated protein FliL
MENITAFIKEKLQEPRNLAITFAIVGFLVGLLFAYVLFPIQWTDASAENLRPDLRVDYLRNAITTYTLTGDKLKAQQSYAELGEKSQETLEELTQNPGFLNIEQIQRFSNAINATMPVADDVLATPGTTLQDGTEILVDGVQPEKETNSLLWVGLGLLGVLLIGGGAAYWFYFREHGFNFGTTSGQEITSEHKVSPQAVRRQVTPAAVQRPPASELQEARPAAQRTSIFANGNNKKPNGYENGNGDKPIAQFMSSYMFADDRYDESFTFDAPNGAFLGECGISISDLIGVGEPKKISAFDVWLFDKNDIQTVTKVIMSKHAFNDPAIRQRLEIRGEPILAEPGKLFRLETATLRMEGRIVDVSYGDLPLPADSYFHRNTIELAVYRK